MQWLMWLKIGGYSLGDHWQSNRQQAKMYEYDDYKQARTYQILASYGIRFSFYKMLLIQIFVSISSQQKKCLLLNDLK